MISEQNQSVYIYIDKVKNKQKEARLTNDCFCALQFNIGNKKYHKKLSPNNNNN